VLVRIHAAGLNPLDSKIRDGAFKPILPYRPPLILGHDLAGVVEAVGAEVSRFRPGDAVFGRPRDGRIGTLAERLAVDEDDLALIPSGLDMTEAAGLPLISLTAWQALVERADLQPGQKVLIHAGSGGFGSIAIQLGRHLGATVATTVSGAHADMARRLGADMARRLGADMARRLGADTVVDYRRQRFETVLSGYDLVVCGQDGDTLARSLKVLRPGGLLISLAGPPTAAFGKAQGLSWAMRQVLRLLSLGIRLKARARGIRYEFLFMRADGSQLAKIASLIAAHALRPVTERIFPFEETNEAFAYLDSGRTKGKVVIALQPGP
jgi:NADPH:quinone reductase-like Zn-dependent oxidoreductase